MNNSIFAIFGSAGVLFTLLSIASINKYGGNMPGIPFFVSAAILYFAFSITESKFIPEKHTENSKSEKSFPWHQILFILVPFAAYCFYTIWQNLIYLSMIDGTLHEIFTQIIAPVLFSVVSSIGFRQSKKMEKCSLPNKENSK